MVWGFLFLGTAKGREGRKEVRDGGVVSLRWVKCRGWKGTRGERTFDVMRRSVLLILRAGGKGMTNYNVLGTSMRARA